MGEVVEPPIWKFWIHWGSNCTFWRYLNGILELQRQFWKQGRACNLTLFETTRITSVSILKTMSLKHAFWWYLKRFGTAEKQMKTMSLKHAFWRYLKRFGTVGKIWKHENKDAYACNMTRFNTIFWLAEQILKAMKLNGAFWRVYARRALGDPIVLPTPLQFSLQILTFYFFHSFRWSVGPGLLGL